MFHLIAGCNSYEVLKLYSRSVFDRRQSQKVVFSYGSTFVKCTNLHWNAVASSDWDGIKLWFQTKFNLNSSWTRFLAVQAHQGLKCQVDISIGRPLSPASSGHVSRDVQGTDGWINSTRIPIVPLSRSGDAQFVEVMVLSCCYNRRRLRDTMMNL